MANELQDPDGLSGPDLDAAGIWAKRYFFATRLLMESVLRPCELGTTQWYVLSLLATDGPLPQRDLTGRLGVERATASGVVATMVKKGLITQEPSPSDKRQLVVNLTPAGRSLWKRIPDPIGLIAQVAFAGIDADDVATAKRVLTDATQHLLDYRKELP